MTALEDRALTCEERDAILNADGRLVGWSVGSSLTDLSGEFGDPRIETVWERDGRRVRDVRHPAPVDEPGPDRAPCEHFELAADREGAQ